MAMDNKKQAETLAIIRHYARRIADESEADIRPSTATVIKERIDRMAELARQLETNS